MAQKTDLGSNYIPIRKVKVHRASRFISGESENMPSCIVDGIEDRGASPIQRITPEESQAEKRRKRILRRLANVYEVPETDAKRFVRDISSLTTRIRDFIVLEIAPLEIAVEAAIEEAIESLEIVTSTKGAGIDSSNLRKVADRISELRILNFMLDLSKVDDNVRRRMYKILYGAKK